MPTIAGNPIGDLMLVVIALSILWGMVGTHQRRRNLKRFWRGWGKGPDWNALVRPGRIERLTKKLEPQIKKAENLRKIALVVTVSVFLVLAIAVTHYSVSQTPMAEVPLFTLLVLAIGILLPNIFYRLILKTAIMPDIAKALGYRYHRKGINLFNRLRNHEDDIHLHTGHSNRFGVGRSSILLGDYHSVVAEDGFETLDHAYTESPWQSGRRVHINMEEIQTYVRKNNQDREGAAVQFRGLLVQLDFGENFPCPILLREDLGGLLNKVSFAPPGMQRIGLEDPEFEKIFEAFSTDQVAARRVLTPRFMEKIKEIASIYHAPVEALFVDSSVFITVRTARNHFELGGIWRPVASPKSLGQLLGQIELQHQVAESLEH